MARLLVVDDDAQMRSLLQDTLVTDGHTITAVSSGVAALGLLQRSDFDLVILDRRMPQMGGIETLKKIRGTSRCAKTKVLMCTSLGLMGQVDEAFKAGATDYIVKPLDLEKLRGKVKALTTGKLV
jgi:CheY-like chemotaxis protein